MLAIYRKYPDKYNLLYTENIQAIHYELADVLVLHRASEAHQYYTEIAKYHPKNLPEVIVIHDVDDNEFHLPSSHPMKTMWLATGKDKMSVECLKGSKFVTTTAKKIASIFKQLNQNVEIHRNRFNWDLPQWNLEKKTGKGKYEGKIVIGWAGLTSHKADLAQMAKILKPIYNKYPNTHFIFAGMALKDTVADIEMVNGQKVYKERDVTDPTQTYKYGVRKLFDYMSDDRIELLDAVGLENYGEFFTMFDISLAYIEDNTFNQSKSEIKFVESMFYKCIPLASNVGSYHELFYDILPEELRNKNILALSNYEAEWVRKLEYWIENIDTEETKSYIDKLSNWTKEFYHIDNYIHERVELYERLLNIRDDSNIVKNGDVILYEKGKIV